MQHTNKKVLIVDSNATVRATLGTFLKGLGHEVFEGATGQEAIDKASSIRPDLIMLDVQLPGLNGDEVTVRLKSNRSTRNIPCRHQYRLDHRLQYRSTRRARL